MTEAESDKIPLFDLRSEDVVQRRLAALRSIVPEAFTEHGLDLDALRRTLGEEVDSGPERFGLTWPGKARAMQVMQQPSIGTLRPCPEESVDWDTTQNLMIEGDNLEVLKLLQKSYAGKVKLIYIDPPYNTGKDFVYPDDLRDGIGNYLRLTGQSDSGGFRTTSNPESSGRFHTAWLSMMLPRLMGLRNVLREDGVILISISDAEVAQLKLLLNEVFGESNFICQFVWNNDGNVDQQSKIKGVHEYVLAYARDLEQIARPSVIDPNIEETSKLYNDQIENSITKNGPANPPSTVTLPAGFPADFASGRIGPQTDSWPHSLDEIIVEDGKLSKAARVHSGWSSRNLLDLYVKNGCVPIQDGTGKETWFGLRRTGAIYGYKRRSGSQGHVLSVIRNVGTTKQNSSVLRAWDIEFSYPKPLLLIQYLIQIFTSPDQGDLVLDAFAGSGTTGHAVLAQNSEDGGNRRFALVQLPEPSRSQHTESLADLTVKRLATAGASLAGSPGRRPGDFGYKKYRLDTSNIEAWEPNRDDLNSSLTDAIEHLKGDRSERDILFELLLKLGLELTVPIETREIASEAVYSVGAGTLLVCLAESLGHADIETIGLGIVNWHEELAPAGETTVVFRDSAFADDVAKTNLTAILEQHGLSNVRSL